MYTHVYLYLWYNWYTPHSWQNRCHLNIPNESFVPCFWLCSYSSNVLPETPIQRGGAYWEDVVVSSKLGCFWNLLLSWCSFHGHSQASFFAKSEWFSKKRNKTDSAQPYHQVLLKVSQQRYGSQIKTFTPDGVPWVSPGVCPGQPDPKTHKDCAEDPVRDLEEALQIPLQKKVLNLQQVTSWISQRGGFFAGGWKDVFVEKKKRWRWIFVDFSEKEQDWYTMMVW